MFIKNWFKAQPKRIQLLILLLVIVGPGLLRYAFLHNSWATYTNERYGYRLEYPAHLWKIVSYNGFKGNREVHLILTWPAIIDITHHISVGTVELEDPTVAEVAAYYEEILIDDGINRLSDLEEIQVDDTTALTRTYTYSSRKWKEVYFAEGNRGYMVRFTAASMFYDSSLQAFNHTVTTFQVLDDSPTE